ncbi:Hypothetical protein POVN_LOCUS192 [uncultured virus]|nr:Hypothetical protein POVN_LOCUS192 [uncultured virus]
MNVKTPLPTRALSSDNGGNIGDALDGFAHLLGSMVAKNNTRVTDVPAFPRCEVKESLFWSGSLGYISHDPLQRLCIEVFDELLFHRFGNYDDLLSWRGDDQAGIPYLYFNFRRDGQFDPFNKMYM